MITKAQAKELHRRAVAALEAAEARAKEANRAEDHARELAQLTEDLLRAVPADTGSNA